MLLVEHAQIFCGRDLFCLHNAHADYFDIFFWKLFLETFFSTTESLFNKELIICFLLCVVVRTDIDCFQNSVPFNSLAGKSNPNYAVRDLTQTMQWEYELLFPYKSSPVKRLGSFFESKNVFLKCWNVEDIFNKLKVLHVLISFTLDRGVPDNRSCSYRV